MLYEQELICMAYVLYIKYGADWEKTSTILKPVYQI